MGGTGGGGCLEIGPTGRGVISLLAFTLANARLTRARELDAILKVLDQRFL